MNIRQTIERFHLLFCKSFLSTQDKSLIAIKGGCNLRFFLGSDRYSEDIDFDIETIAKDTLRRRVDKILSGKILGNALAPSGIQIVAHSAPKQTETVQRWKILLRHQGMEIPSKIEFSRRGIDHKGVVFEPIDPIVLAEHRLPNTFLAHYTARHAMIQKIEALAHRTETQARDVYDLGHLLRRYPNEKPQVTPELSAKAIECAMSVDFDQFCGQVVEYLEGDGKSFYSAHANWEKLQLGVISELEKEP